MLSPVPPKMTEDPLSINAIMKMKIGHTEPTDKQWPLSFPHFPANTCITFLLCESNGNSELGCSHRLTSHNGDKERMLLNNLN